MDYHVGWCMTCEKRIASSYIYCSLSCQFQDFLMDDQSSHNFTGTDGYHASECMPTAIKMSSSSSTHSSYSATSSSSGSYSASMLKPTSQSVNYLEEWIVSDESSSGMSEGITAFNSSDSSSGCSKSMSGFISTRSRSGIPSPPPSPSSFLLMNGVPKLLGRGRQSPYASHQRVRCTPPPSYISA
ncbi:hypothetical protein MT418_003135 [Batrachochytrium dendrobatidis]